MAERVDVRAHVAAQRDRVRRGTDAALRHHVPVFLGQPEQKWRMRRESAACPRNKAAPDRRLCDRPRRSNKSIIGGAPRPCPGWLFAGGVPARGFTGTLGVSSAAHRPKRYLPLVARCHVRDGDRNRAAGIARVSLLNLLRLRGIGSLHRHAVRILQRRIERKLDLVPHRHVPGGLAIVIELAAFQIAKMSDIMDGRVPPANLDGLLARTGQRRALWERADRRSPAARRRLRARLRNSA